jgi:hypothetical protein
MFYLLKNPLLLILVIFKLKCNNLFFNEIVVLNASYVCLHAFLLYRESPDLDPVRQTPHFKGGSVTMSLNSQQFSSSMPPQDDAALVSHHPMHVEMPPIDDDNNISIHSQEDLAWVESIHVREFAPTRVYDVSLLEHMGLDIQLPTVIRSIGCGKLYDETHSGSRIMTLEFLMIFETYEHDGNPWVFFICLGKHITLIFAILVS